MSALPRRNITELLTRYQLEPSIRDVFVEGDFDRDVIEQCLERGTPIAATHSVYSISTVEVPGDRLAALGLTDGNKQRLIALAHDLGAASAGDSYRCIVDRDLDHWFSELQEAPGLRWTAHCTLEVYFYTDKILLDILKTTAQCRIPDWHQFRSSFEEALFSLYAFRLAARDLDIAVSWISFDRCLSVNASSVSFDAEEYERRLLNANNSMPRLNDWRTCVAGWRAQIGHEPRLSIRGHDLVALLTWAIRAYRGSKQFADSKAIERLFVLLADRVRPEVLALID